MPFSNFRFMNILSKSRIINVDKTETNINEMPFKKERITYFGREIDLNTKEISNAFQFPKGTEIRHRFKFWHSKKKISPQAYIFISYT